MDNYFEQSVAGKRGAREQFAYAACWAGVVLMALVAMFSAVNILGIDSERIVINWTRVIVLVVTVALAVLLYFRKDRIYLEYDYTLWNSELEVCAVYNRKRRKKVATIQLGHVNAWGPIGAMTKQMHNAKRHNWYVNESASCCLVFSGDSGKEAAILELSEEMCAEIRATNRAMRMSEVKP